MNEYEQRKYLALLSALAEQDFYCFFFTGIGGWGVSRFQYYQTQPIDNRDWVCLWTEIP